MFGPERPVVQPLPPQGEEPQQQQQRPDERLDQEWLDRVTGQPRRDAVRTPPPARSAPPARPAVPAQSGERPNQ